MHILGVIFITAAIYHAAAFTLFESGARFNNGPHIFRHDGVPGHQLRIRPTDKSLCAGNEGISGYVDIDEGDKHLFFWAFESRNDPLRDPVILWMTGGPGCSGTGVGALIELGPCKISDKNTTISNPHAWNNNATIIFIDQPLNVGFSYSSNKTKKLNDATKDTHKFLILFFALFQKLKFVDFYIAGESYGGSWVPHLANHILELQTSSLANLAKVTYSPPLPEIQLKGIMLGNVALSDTHQWKGFFPTGCLGETPLLNASVCKTMAIAQPRCQSLLESCRAADHDPIICREVLQYCREHSVFAIFDTGRNPYDIRRQCEGGYTGTCYDVIDTAALYLNQPWVKEGLGVDSKFEFAQCNSEIVKDFEAIGDVNRPSDGIVGQLLDQELRVLIYVGDQDWYCNAAGMISVVNELAWEGQSEFRLQQDVAWNVNGVVAGSKKTFKNLSFVTVYDSGHMVPMDKAEESSMMLNSWISGTLQRG